MTELTITQTKTMINENFEIRKEINEIKVRFEEVLDSGTLDAVSIKIVRREIDRMEAVIHRNNVILTTVPTNWQ